MQLIIEKGVPYPGMKMAEKKRNRGRIRQYPLDRMAIGDSFVHPDDGTTTKKLQQAVSNFRHRTNAKTNFIVAPVDEGVRCWRVPLAHVG